MIRGIVSVSDKITRSYIEEMADDILCFLSVLVASWLDNKQPLSRKLSGQSHKKSLIRNATFFYNRASFEFSKPFIFNTIHIHIGLIPKKDIKLLHRIHINYHTHRFVIRMSI